MMAAQGHDIMLFST